MGSPTFTQRLGNLRRMLFSRGARARTIDARGAKDLQLEGAIIVDVRQGAEWRAGHIPGARHVPMSEVESRLDEIPRDTPVVVHCALGTRGALAAKRLQELGFKDVHNLEGGIQAWKKEGLTLAKDD